MSAATRVLAMLAGVMLIQVLWLANKHAAKNHWLAAITDDEAGDPDEDSDEPTTR